MKQYTFKEFEKLLLANGFILKRQKGDHKIYVNAFGRHISIPKNVESVIAERLIKENNLSFNAKKCKYDKK